MSFEQLLAPATQGDVDAVEALLKSAFAQYARRLGKPAPGPYPWLRSAVADEQVFIAGGPVPTGAVIIIPGRVPERLTLKMMAVAPAQAGQGLGRRLLGEAVWLARARGARILDLRTLAELNRLVAFYSRAGFIATEVSPDPADGIPRIHMDLDLFPSADRVPR